MARHCIACGDKAKRRTSAFDHDCALCAACDRSLVALANTTELNLFDAAETPVLIKWAATRARDRERNRG